MENRGITNNLDWICIMLYIALVVIGWFNIYAASLPVEEVITFNSDEIYGKQLIWIILCIPLIVLVLLFNPRFYERFSSVFYLLSLVALMGLFVFGKTIKGQTNWYVFGSISLQPSEFVKITIALALAKYLSNIHTNLSRFDNQIKAFIIIIIPMLLILKQPDTGTAIILAIFVLILYREGLPPIYIWVGITVILLFIVALIIEPEYIIVALFLIISLLYWYLKMKKIKNDVLIYLFIFTVVTIYSYVSNSLFNLNSLVNPIYIAITLFMIAIFLHLFFRARETNRSIPVLLLILIALSTYVYTIDYIFDNLLDQHQKDRIDVILGKNKDLKGVGYNTNQSQIAIGSGGILGKGYLEGTQTKGSFVPEQHTDYIFTTIGEEWGFLGCFVVIVLFVSLVMRVLYLSEKQKNKFSRIYGYGVAAILFIHFFLNIAMVIGIFPTIGVPLPFFSYGGSSLWSFTILLFIFIKLNANRIHQW